MTAHDRVLAATTRLLQAVGVQAMTIEQIIAEAGVARMTPYRHFGGKDRLVAAALEEWGTHRVQSLHARLDQGTDDPGTRLARLFAAIDQEVSEGHPGSLMLTAAIELRGEPDHPARAVVEAHQQAVRQLLEDLAKLAGADDCTEMAAQLELVFHGALATAVVEGRPAGTVAAVATAVLQAHIRNDQGPPRAVPAP